MKKTTLVLGSSSYPQNKLGALLPYKKRYVGVDIIRHALGPLSPVTCGEITETSSVLLL